MVLTKPSLPRIIVLFAYLLIHLVNIYYVLAYYIPDIVLSLEGKEK